MRSIIMGKAAPHQATRLLTVTRSTCNGTGSLHHLEYVCTGAFHSGTGRSQFSRAKGPALKLGSHVSFLESLFSREVCLESWSLVSDWTTRSSTSWPGCCPSISSPECAQSRSLQRLLFCCLRSWSWLCLALWVWTLRHLSHWKLQHQTLPRLVCSDGQRHQSPQHWVFFLDLNDHSTPSLYPPGQNLQHWSFLGLLLGFHRC